MIIEMFWICMFVSVEEIKKRPNMYLAYIVQTQNAKGWSEDFFICFSFSLFGNNLISCVNDCFPIVLTHYRISCCLPLKICLGTVIDLFFTRELMIKIKFKLINPTDITKFGCMQILAVFQTCQAFEVQHKISLINLTSIFTNYEQAFHELFLSQM